jgi:CheY-like chemotaxis protein
MSGRVNVTWELRPDDLVLRWTETGGPSTQPPVSPGFGVRVISASIERQLEGEAKFDWHPEGLRCSLAVPRGDKIEPLSRSASAHRASVDAKSALPLQLETGNRVLLVEDEILVAMMMRDILTDLGFTVVGPFSRLSEAMVAAVHEDIDAGIIDINLGGEFVYPVADVLAARKLPFVFVTGYGVDSIDGRFAYVPIVKKPVQRQVLQSIFIPAESKAAATPANGRYAAGRAALSRAAASAGRS